MSAAEDKLILAIGEVLEERGCLGAEEMLGDWHVMCEVQILSEDRRGRTKYVNVIPGEDGTPMHRVIGLIQVCQSLLGEEEE